MHTVALLYTTLATIEEAEKLAEKAVAEKYAACVNIIPNALSVYAWEEKIEKSSECLLIFKTDTSRLQDLENWIKTHHPYSVPALIKGNIECSDEFRQYIQSYIEK